MSMTLVASGSIGSSITSITSIPQDGTDLVLFLHMRTTASTTNATAYVYFNNLTSSSVYSGQRLRGQPAVPQTSGQQQTNVTDVTSFEIPGTSIGSDNYSTVRIHITNYAGSNPKPFITEQVMSSTSTNNPYNLAAGRTSQSTAISSIQIKEQQNSGNGVWSLYKVTAG